MASPHLQGCWVKFAIELHPSRSNDVMGGVKEHLNDMLLRYNEDLEAVVLSYSRERILGTQARIHPYFPYFHVDVIALVFLFKPAVGTPMTGVVNAIGQDYIGVLVLGIFNAAIGRTQIPAHVQYRPLEDCWSSSKDRHGPLQVGSALRFTVHKVDHGGEFFMLAGSLLEPEKSQRPAATVGGRAGLQQGQEDFARAATGRASSAPLRAEGVGSDGSPAAQAAPLSAVATPSGAAQAAADGGTKQQPEHRKKSKRRHSIAATPGATNGLDSGIKPPKKKKRKTEPATA